jgi:hypothetical protein
MKGECCAARAAAGGIGLGGVGVVLGIAALLVPKCPVCVAAWLAVLGLGAGATGIAGSVGAWGEPVGWAVLAASTMGLGSTAAALLVRRVAAR